MTSYSFVITRTRKSFKYNILQTTPPKKNHELLFSKKHKMNEKLLVLGNLAFDDILDLKKKSLETNPTL